MAMSGFEPAPLTEPTTERVRGGRRPAIVVSIVAILVVGTLVWKPWDKGGTGAQPAPRPLSSLPAFAAVPTAPSAAPTPVATATAPTGPDPGSVPSPLNLGFIKMPSDYRGAFVYCVYGASRRSGNGLITMIINGPVVTLGSPARGLVRTVGLVPEIEANSLAGVFSQDWSLLVRGRVQKIRPDSSLVALFNVEHVRVNVAKLPASAVLRAALAVTWIGPDGATVATQRVYPWGYAPLGDTSTVPVPEGCPARN